MAALMSLNLDAVAGILAMGLKPLVQPSKQIQIEIKCMLEHYGFTQEQFDKLHKKCGLTIADLYYMIDDFQAHNAPVSKISLFYYADRHGDFTEGSSKSDLVAREVFKRLPIKDKIELGEYFDWLEGNKKK